MSKMPLKYVLVFGILFSFFSPNESFLLGEAAFATDHPLMGAQPPDPINEGAKCKSNVAKMLASTLVQRVSAQLTPGGYRGDLDFVTGEPADGLRKSLIVMADGKTNAEIIAAMFGHNFVKVLHGDLYDGSVGIFMVEIGADEFNLFKLRKLARLIHDNAGRIAPWMVAEARLYSPSEKIIFEKVSTATYPITSPDFVTGRTVSDAHYIRGLVADRDSAERIVGMFTDTLAKDDENPAATILYSGSGSTVEVLISTSSQYGLRKLNELKRLVEKNDGVITPAIVTKARKFLY